MGSTADRDGLTAVLIVPAYNPSPMLSSLVREVRDRGLFESIIIVDDGSSEWAQPVFREVEVQPGTTVLRHAVNLGKGAALKTGLNAALVRHGPAVGVVTMDADGQHEPDDARAVCAELARHPESLVLGVRRFGSGTPFRSRLGNLATKALLRFLVGLRLSDTQTGLRGIPGPIARRLLRLDSQRFEFELDMLILCKHLGWPIREVPISTIYRDQNRSSHFNPLTDSFRIYRVLFRFVGAALVTALLDNVLFVAFYSLRFGVTMGHGLARLFSPVLNYALLRRFVFLSDQRHARVIPKYLLVVAIWWMLSLVLIRLVLVASDFRMSVLQSKMLVEGILFPVNFLIQRDWVFRRSS